MVAAFGNSLLWGFLPSGLVTFVGSLILEWQEKIYKVGRTETFFGNERRKFLNSKFATFEELASFWGRYFWEFTVFGEFNYKCWIKRAFDKLFQRINGSKVILFSVHLTSKTLKIFNNNFISLVFQ